MRLTLRTLLAYLDEVLEPGDSQQLATKIRESDFASGLVHRIRSAMSRLRLSCPEPLARGLAEDANAVGEYIDSTLHEDRVTDFERVCLESDMHLAEVASCHQIVTWVVREPAQVPAGLRERVHQLGGNRFKMEGGGYQRVDDVLAELDGDDSNWKDLRTEADDATRPSAKRRPDYMSAGRKSAAPWIVAALAGVLLVVGYLIGTARDPRQTAEVPALPVEPAAADVSDAGVPPGNEPASSVQPTDPSELRQLADPADTSISEVSRGQSMEPPRESVLGDPSVAVEEPVRRMSGEPTQDAVGDVISGRPASAMNESDFPATADAELNARPAMVPAVPAGPPDATPDELNDELTSGGTPVDAGLATSAPMDGRGDPTASDVTDSGLNEQPMPPPNASLAEATTGSPDAAADLSPVPEKEADPEPVDAGRYISDREVMAYWDGESGLWKRLEPRASLQMGTRMRVPSAFRPQLLLGNGVQVTFAGRSELFLEQPAAGNSPIVRMNYGRVIFVTMGQESDRVAILAGGKALEVIFGDTESQFAIEVSKRMLPGEDPMTADRQQTVHVWVTSGRVDVRESGQETFAVESGQEWRAEDGQEPQLVAVEAMPDWIEGAQLSDIDRTALMKVEPLLQLDRSLTLSLSEAAESRRQEVRSLAARCLASLERFEPLASALADPKQHPSWQAQFQELQAAIARNPETANRVQEALAATAGSDSDRLFRMLWGYTKAQLEGGAALELIDELESSSLARRVMAFQNLHAATQKTLYYRPEKPAARRKEAATQWRRQWNGGQILIQPTRPISTTD